MRFYRDERTAFCAAYLHKNKEGLDGDGILKLLPKEAIVMHDHNKVNYNKEYNVHLLRNIQKTRDIVQHQWSDKLKNILEKTNTQRNKKVDKEKNLLTMLM